jgi:type III restriction enzyme
MSDILTIKTESLEPLFAAWEEPAKHRVRAESGMGAEEWQGRRPSGIAIAQNLRAEVKMWRDAFYPGASKTTRYLLNHWFGRAHNVGGNEFRYYFKEITS